MAYVWVPAHAWAVGVGLLIMAAAVALYFSAPQRVLNRRLGLMLLAQGFGFATSWGLANMTTDPGHAQAWNVLGYVAYAALLPLYLLFLACLKSPLVRPLSGRIPTLLLWSATIAAGITAVVWSELFASGLIALPDGRWSEGYGILGEALPMAHGFLPLFGLLVAWDQWRRSRTQIARRQASAYVVAFGWRDLNWALVLLVLLPLIGSYDTEASQTPAWLVATMGATELIFVGLLAYAVLSAQLFDIDLKIKWTVNRGSLAAIFIAVFFIASEGAQVLFSEFAGNEFIGILAAGLLVFAIAPLQRFADRISDRAMPNVVDDEEYRLVRKRQVYQAAVESALVDGSLSDKERDVLATLADELGLSAGDARTIERDLHPVAGAA